MVYVCLMLAILLYGAESWCLTEKLYNRLRVFHSRCIREMCLVNRKHTRDHHISNEDLRRRTGILPIAAYVSRIQLRWVGMFQECPIVGCQGRWCLHGCEQNVRLVHQNWRMDELCRKLSEKLMFPPNDWQNVAEDREQWRRVCNGLCWNLIYFISYLS